MYTPGGNGVRRYSPLLSETATTDGTCKAGPVALTVTPGRTAPDVSVITPTMPALLCAAGTTGKAKTPISPITPVSSAPDDTSVLHLNMKISLIAPEWTPRFCGPRFPNTDWKENADGP